MDESSNTMIEVKKVVNNEYRIQTVIKRMGAVVVCVFVCLCEPPLFGNGSLLVGTFWQSLFYVTIKSAGEIPPKTCGAKKSSFVVCLSSTVLLSSSSHACGISALEPCCG